DLEEGRADELADSIAPRAIADLIVILQAAHEGMPAEARGRAAVTAPAVLGPATVVHKSARQRRRQIAEGLEVGVVPHLLARERDVQRVVEILVPLRVEAEAPDRRVLHDARVVQIALRDQAEPPPEMRLERAHLGGQL